LIKAIYHIFSVICLVVLVILTNPGVSRAGEYFLIEREKYQLCRELVKNFNRYKNDPPMVCERKFHSDYKNFTLPKWSTLDPEKNIELLERLLVKEARKERNKSFPALVKRIKEGRAHLWKAEIDINFDGKSNTVFMLTTHKCDPVRDFNKGIAPVLTFMAEQNYPNPNKPAFKSLNGKLYGGIFYYKGRPYFHSWDQWPLFNTERSKNIDGPKPRIAVYETNSPMLGLYESFGRRPVCEIGYKEQKNNLKGK